MGLHQVVQDLVHAPLAAARLMPGLGFRHAVEKRVHRDESLRDPLPDLRGGRLGAALAEVRLGLDLFGEHRHVEPPVER